MSIIIIFDVNHDYICRSLCLCGVYLSSNSSGTDIKNRQQSVKILKVRLIGDVALRKI